MNALGGVSLLLSAVVGGLLVNRAWALPDRPVLRTLFVTVPVVGALSAFGLVEAVMTLYPATVISIEIFAQALLAAWLLTKRNSVKPPQEIFERSQATAFLQSCFFVSFGVSLVTFLSGSVLAPHGGWDAWSIWNLRARFLYRGGVNWQASFSPLIAWSHPDYPLLLPGTVAHLWTVLAHETTMVPIAIAIFYTFGTVLLLREWVSVLKGPFQGSLAGLALLGTRAFFGVGVEQIADVPLAFLTLAGVGLLAWLQRRRDLSATWSLVGLAAALGAWTKNEGILIGLALAACVLAETLRRRDKRPGKFFLFGAALPACLGLAFKAFLAPKNDIAEALRYDAIMNKLQDGARWREVFKCYTQDLWRFGLFIGPALLIYLLLTRGARPSRGLNLAFIPLMTAILLAMYFFVYLVGPYDATYYVHSSATRLMVQLWPSLLLALFCATDAPIEK